MHVVLGFVIVPYISDIVKKDFDKARCMNRIEIEYLK